MTQLPPDAFFPIRTHCSRKTQTGSFMADSGNTSSQRGALRFPGGARLLNYKTDYEDGEARLLNISRSGCAISEATTELHIGQKILIILNLEEPEKQLQLQAAILRVQTEGIALQFLHLEEKTTRRLLRFFAKETRRQKNDLASAS